MIKKISITLLLIVLLTGGLFVGYKIYDYHTSKYSTIYVASHQLYQRNQITIEDLEEIKVPRGIINDDIYTSKQDIIGKYVKLSYSIPKGSFIYKTSIEEDIKDLANTLLKNNEVNYDIYTSDVKINTGNLNKNMYIDLYLTINNKDKPVSDLLISNARIIGLYDVNNKAIYDYDVDSKVSIISLAINRDAINVLNKAQVVGDLNCIVSTNTYKTDLLSTINVSSPLLDYLQ